MIFSLFLISNSFVQISFGSSDYDLISGNDGNDIIKGNSGSDVIDEDTNSDRCYPSDLQ